MFYNVMTFNYHNNGVELNIEHKMCTNNIIIKHLKLTAASPELYVSVFPAVTRAGNASRSMTLVNFIVLLHLLSRQYLERRI